MTACGRMKNEDLQKDYLSAKWSAVIDKVGAGLAKSRPTGPEVLMPPCALSRTVSTDITYTCID